MVFSNFYRLPTIPCSERDNHPGSNIEITDKAKRQEMCLGLNPNQILNSTFPTKANPLSAFNSHPNQKFDYPNSGKIGIPILNSSDKNCSQKCLDDNNCIAFQMTTPESKCLLYSSNQFINSAGINFPGISETDYERTSYLSKLNPNKALLGEPINYFNKGSSNQTINGTILTSQNNITENQCAGLCNGTTNCKSFNYFSPKNSCQLYNSSQTTNFSPNTSQPNTNVFIKKTNVPPLIHVPASMEQYYSSYPTEGMIGDNICKFNGNASVNGSCVLEKVVGGKPISSTPQQIGSNTLNSLPNQLPNLSVRSTSCASQSASNNSALKINGKQFYQCQTNSPNNLCITSLNYANNLGLISPNPNTPNPPYQNTLATQNFEVFLNKDIPNTVLPYASANQMKNLQPTINQLEFGLLSNVEGIPDNGSTFQTLEGISNLECQRYCEKDGRCSGFMEVFNEIGDRECKFYSLRDTEWDVYKKSSTNRNLMSNLYIKNRYPYLVDGKIKPVVESFIDANRINRCSNCCKINPQECCLDCNIKNFNGRSFCPDFASNQVDCNSSAFGCCDFPPLKYKNDQNGTNCDSIGSLNNCQNDICSKFPYSCCQDCLPQNNRTCPTTIHDPSPNTNFNCSTSMYGCCSDNKTLKLDSMGLNCPNLCQPSDSICANDLTDEKCCVNCSAKQNNYDICQANYFEKENNGISCNNSKWGCCYGTGILKNNRFGTNCPKTTQDINRIRNEENWKCGNDFNIKDKTALCCIGNNNQIYQNQEGSNCALTPDFTGDPFFQRSMIESFSVNNPIIPQTTDQELWGKIGSTNMTAISSSSQVNDGSFSSQDTLKNLFGTCPPPNDTVIKVNSQGTNCSQFSDSLGNLLMDGSDSLKDNLVCKFSNGEYKMDDLIMLNDPKMGDINSRVNTIINGIKNYVDRNKIKNVINNSISFNILSAEKQQINTFKINLDNNDTILKVFIYYKLNILKDKITHVLNQNNLTINTTSVSSVGIELKNIYDPSGLLGNENDWKNLVENMILIGEVVCYSTIMSLFIKISNFPFYLDVDNKCLYRKLVLAPLVKALYDKLKANQISRSVFNKTVENLISFIKSSIFQTFNVLNINDFVSKIIYTYDNPTKPESVSVISNLDKTYQLCTTVVKPNGGVDNLEGCSGPYISLNELGIYFYKKNGNSNTNENIIAFYELIDNSYKLYMEDLYLKNEEYNNSGIILSYFYNNNSLLSNDNIEYLKGKTIFRMLRVDESRKNVILNVGYIEIFNLMFLFSWAIGGINRFIRNVNLDNTLTLKGRISNLINQINILSSSKPREYSALPLEVFYDFEVFNMINSLFLAKLIIENGKGDLTSFLNKKCENIYLYKIKNCLNSYDLTNQQKYESGCCWNGFTDRGLYSEGCSSNSIKEECFYSTFGCCANGLALPNPQFQPKADLKGTNCSKLLGLNSFS